MLTRGIKLAALLAVSVFADEPAPVVVPPSASSKSEQHHQESSRPSKLPMELTDAKFDHDTQLGTHDTTGPWFIKFYAPWCGHCRRMEQDWNVLADELDGIVNVGSVDATQNTHLAERFKISGYPTLLFFKDQHMYKHNGPRTAESLKKWVLDEAYAKTPGEPIPKPLTLIDALKRRLMTLIIDFEHIITKRLGAGSALAFAGLSAGSLIGAVLVILFLPPRLFWLARRKAAKC